MDRKTQWFSLLGGGTLFLYGGKELFVKGDWTLFVLSLLILAFTISSMLKTQRK